MATQENRAELINSGTVDGLLAFCDYLIEKGYATSGGVSPWKSAVKQVFEAVEGPEYADTDVRELDLDSYLRRWENMERGHYKAESLQSYGSRARRAHEAYLAYLENGTTPKLGRRTPRRKETDARSDTATTPQRNGGGGSGGASAVADLVDYPFPLRSGQLAYLRLPRQVERSDAERIAAFVQALVSEPTAGPSKEA